MRLSRRLPALFLARTFLALTSLLAVAGAALAADGNRLVYLDENDPYYPSLEFPKLVTPQWIGEEDVDAVVVLAIDDMRGHEKWEAYLRPILERLKQIDGRAPASIMTCRIEPEDPHLQTWLKEGLSLEIHTYDHPCPLLCKNDFAQAKGTFDRCVDLLNQVPHNRPTAFRTPCCDSLNTVSPRTFAEIFNKVTPEGHFLTIDSSVFNVFTSNDPQLPRELVLEAEGKDRFRKYVPYDRSFVNTIENYPYPYVIGRLCWQFPCNAPSDWSAQHLQKPNNPLTVADMQAAIDATVVKQGVFNLVFHPHGWIRNDQVVAMIDHAVARHGKRVKFLTFREAQDRIDRHLLAGQPLRAASGQDNGVRLVDLNADGYLDVVIGNDKLRRTRIWSPEQTAWIESDFPAQLVAVDGEGSRGDAGARFGIVGKSQQAALLLRNETTAAAWRFDGRSWVADASLLAGLELNGQPLLAARQGRDQGLRLRDLDGDGQTECIIGNAQQQAVFRYDEPAQRWRSLPFALPAGAAVVDAQGRDAGLRFVDIDEDGDQDVIFSNESHYSLDLFVSPEQGWSRRVLAGKRPGDDAIPPIVAGGMNNGAWFHSRHLWVQNETTDRLDDLVDRRAFAELLKDVEPEARSAQASLRSIKTRPGFHVELVAAEPLVMDPVAFAWGADGKLWVVEMADYPLGIDGQGKHGGRVRYLEDADGDGRYDKSTLFLDGLGYPNGVTPWRNGVLVTCAPEIFYAEDTDGDGRADVRKTLYRGFVEGNQQHRVNGLRWGLDNWIYGANGDSGGEIESVKTGERVAISGRDFRLRPDEGLIETQAGQTQFARERDDWGNWFGSNNSNPMYQFVLDEHYLRRNPHVSPPNGRVQVSEAPGAAPVFPASRTVARFNDLSAVNRFTSACSSIIYRDDLFGPQYSGNSFVCEPVHNLVHREVLHAEGVVFHSRRADDERLSEFLASTDNWSRPVMVRMGPDGALWIADMYRQVLEHPQWIPKEWQQRLDLRAGHDKGRIYRVCPVGKTPRPLPRLDRLDAAALVAALDSPSGWQRDMAQQLLVHRGDQAAAPLLKKLLGDRARPPLARLHALCTLDGLKALDAPTLLVALSDPHPGVLRHAVRLSEPLLDQSPELTAALEKLTATDDAHLRLQLAYSLGEWHAPAAGRLLGQLALSAGDDPYLTAAALSSVNQQNLPETVAAVLAESGKRPPSISLVAPLMNMSIALKSDAALAAGLAAIAKPASDKPATQRYAAWQLAAVGGLLDSLGRRRTSLSDFRKQTSDELKTSLARLDDMFAFARSVAVDEEAADGDRIAAISLLGRGPGEHRDSDLNTLAELLSPRTPRALQSAAVAAISRFAKQPRAPALLLAGWRSYSPELQSQIADAMLARPAWTKALLDEIAAGRLTAAALDAARRQRLLSHSDAAIRALAEKTLAGSINADRQKVVAHYRQAMQLAGDAARGAQVFKKACSLCHRLGETGHAVGPDLTALTDKSPESLLVAMFDPNRAVEAKFMSYTAVTEDGVTHTGMLGAETATSVTLVASEGKQVSLLRKDLELLDSSSKSLMPEGLEKDLTPQNAADLISYLGGVKPPRKQFPGNAPELVRPEALRGELWLLAANAEIYGKTLIFEPNFRNLGYWTSSDDHAVWTIEILRPGAYNVSLDYACDNSSAGKSVAVEAAGKRLVRQTPGTGSWDAYRPLPLGRLELPVGKHRFVVRPDGPLDGALLDLKAVRLVPVK